MAAWTQAATAEPAVEVPAAAELLPPVVVGSSRS